MLRRGVITEIVWAFCDPASSQHHNSGKVGGGGGGEGDSRKKITRQYHSYML